jgi:hypothetical protein
MSTAPRLTVDPERDHAGGGSVTYRVTIDERWIGWVGDMRPWRGWRFGGRKWWACWREEGDNAARWNSGFSDDDGHKTRAAALAALLAQVNRD